MIPKLATVTRFSSRLVARLWGKLGSFGRKRRPEPSLQATSRRATKTVVCREGWYYITLSCLVFGAAMLREVNLMLILGGMLFGPMLFNWRLAIVTLRGLEARRKLPRGVCAGDLLVVDIELTNTRRKIGSWAVRVRESIRREGNGDFQPIELAEFFAYVPPGGTLVRGYRGRLPQRGRYQWEPTRISTRFPFGLLQRETVVGTADTLLVFPRLGRLTQGWMQRQHESFEGTQRRERRDSRVSGDFYGVREWRHGDSRRCIDWRATARHGTLIVRRFEQHRNRDVAVLLDPWQPKDPSPRQIENVELAISFAATVVAEICRKVGCNLLLGAPSPELELVSGTASSVLLQDAMARLAMADASDRDHLPELLELALNRIEPGTEIVVVGTRDVDFKDPSRFASLSQDPARQARLSRARIVTTADGNLDKYFQAE